MTPGKTAGARRKISSRALHHIREKITKARTSDLTLGNFFSTGWKEPWARRARETPDMSLLRVQANFLVQLFRANLALRQNPESSAMHGSDSLTGTLEYAFMAGVEFPLTEPRPFDRIVQVTYIVNF